MPTAPTPRKRPWQPERKAQEGRAERTKEYDTHRWRQVRKQHLQINPLCVECTKQGRTTAATVLDHKIPVRQEGEFWNPDNYQGLCSSCHNIKSAKERHGKQS